MPLKKLKVEELRKLDGDVPVLQSVPYGLQHILAMFVANLAPVSILAGVAGLSGASTALVIQSALLIAGIGTLIQLFPLFGKVGSGLPIVMGCSFTFLTVMIGIAATSGYGAVLGAVIAGGIIEGILGLLAKYWRRIISPIVAASVVTAIGFSLLSVGATSFGGGDASSPEFGSWVNLGLGAVSLSTCLIFQAFAKGIYKQLSVLAGLIVGYLVAVVLGMVDFSAFADLKLFALPAFVFCGEEFVPVFDPGAIFAIVLIFMVSATETIGDTSALANSGLKRDVTDKELSGSIACDGFVSALSGVFGCIPITSFSQNVGLVAMTGVVNRRAIATGAVIMICAAFVPAISTFFCTLPDAVLGGCTIMMFGNIVVAGFQMMGKAGFTQRNIVIAALSLSMGLGFTSVSSIFVNFPVLFQDVFAANCVAVVFVVAVVSNLVLPKDMSIAGNEGDAAAAPAEPAEPAAEDAA
ncbi:MAG: nucleobase:cation symporter-2 family protein [Coriobacteriia bacterium]|nr:nucleobase:cation symporter-2 family protein [Coriobacteriia bacterium]